MNMSSRVNDLDWNTIHANLDEHGFASLGPLLKLEECVALQQAYDDESSFRNRVVMKRHDFGQGEYKYYAYPLPDIVSRLRMALYPHAAKAANRWATMLGQPERFPDVHDDYLAECHAQGQCRPTPLILKYGAGDYNCLHQDLYGDEVFPLQVAILLSQPQQDFEGGEFVLVEQRPRMQSKANVVPFVQGEAIIFAVNQRPRQGSRGYHRSVLRHGVSQIRKGQRFTMGLIFHDAT